MIAPIFTSVPCPCGRPHRMPVGLDGRIGWICGSTRKVYTLTLEPAKVQALIARTPPTEAALAGEGRLLLHRAGAHRAGQQRCDQCGWLLASYRKFLRFHPGAPVAWWPAGAAVGRSIDGSYYLATLPPSPDLERMCFLPAGVH